MKFLVLFAVGLAAAAPFADVTHGPDEDAESYALPNPLNAFKPIGGLLGAAVGGLGGAVAGTFKGGAEGAAAGAAYGYGAPSAKGPGLPKFPGFPSPKMPKMPKMPKAPQGMPKGLPLPPAGWGASPPVSDVPAAPAAPAAPAPKPATDAMAGMNMK